MSNKDNTFKVLQSLQEYNFNMELNKNKTFWTLFETADYMHELVLTKKQLQSFIEELKRIENTMQ